MLISIMIITVIKKAKIKLAFFLSHSFSFGNSNTKIGIFDEETTNTMFFHHFYAI